MVVLISNQKTLSLSAGSFALLPRTTGRIIHENVIMFTKRRFLVFLLDVCFILFAYILTTCSVLLLLFKLTLPLKT